MEKPRYSPPRAAGPVDIDAIRRGIAEGWIDGDLGASNDVAWLRALPASQCGDWRRSLVKLRIVTDTGVRVMRGKADVDYRIAAALRLQLAESLQRGLQDDEREARMVEVWSEKTLTGDWRIWVWRGEFGGAWIRRSDGAPSTAPDEVSAYLNILQHLAHV